MAPIKGQLLTGLTMAEPVILTMKNAFSESLYWNTVSFVHAI